MAPLHIYMDLLSNSFCVDLVDITKEGGRQSREVAVQFCCTVLKRQLGDRVHLHILWAEKDTLASGNIPLSEGGMSIVILSKI